MTVLESGKLGPLEAQKVTGFGRTLVSVADLADLPGCKEVVFNKRGVFLRTTGNSLALGRRTQDNLYSFDDLSCLDKLQTQEGAGARRTGVRRRTGSSALTQAPGSPPMFAVDQHPESRRQKVLAPRPTYHRNREFRDQSGRDNEENKRKAQEPTSGLLEPLVS